MTPLIRILDPHSANQIAAGEVVERPVSVIKELVENSLDAGAKHIDIVVDGSGVSLLSVRDDGRGISPAEMPLAVLRHATSKIHTIEDLTTLTTLGFRGEALPSIASVSRLEITSRPAGEIAGRSLLLEGGKQISFQETGAPQGTTVRVENLFYNTPARLKFLRSANTEFGLISDTIGRMALSHPDVVFHLSHPRQVVMQTPGGGKLLESIGAVWGRDLARKLLPLSSRQGSWSVEGYLSPPDLVRSSRQAITFIVNGRYIRSSLLARALEEGYHTLIPVKLHPMAVLHLTLPASEYDVNVHPTKMEVKFAQEQALAQFLTNAVRQALLRDAPIPSWGEKERPRTYQGRSQLPQALQTLAAVWKKPLLSFEESGVRESESSISAGLAPGSWADATGLGTSALAGGPAAENSQSAPSIPDISTPVVDEAPPPLPDAVFPESGPPAHSTPAAAPESLFDLSLFPSAETLTGFNLWPLAQVFTTYILATDGRTLVIIDQHAAHERINYERLLRETRAQGTASQALLLPLPLEFTLQEEQVVLEHLWALEKLGFVLEYFGTRTYLLRSVPAQAVSHAPELLLRQFIDEILQSNSPPSYDQLLEEWIYLLACKESIKAKESLSLLEMEQLLAQLAQAENPHTCPHGRPTMIQISQSELEHRFYRK